MVMLRSRRVGLSFLYGLRRANLANTRSNPSRSFQSSNYSDYSANGARNKKSNITAPIYEDQEPDPKWKYYAIPTAFLTLVGLGTFVRYNDKRRAITKDRSENTVPDRVNINRPAIGGPFKLYDTNNNEINENNLKGKWSLLYFGYTSCPDFGPEEVNKMAQLISILESRYNFEITPVFITIDPQRDSPTQLKAYLQEFDPRIIGLTGPISCVRQVAQEYRVFFRRVDEIGQDYLIESSPNMYLLDPNLETVRIFGREYDAVQLANAILMEVKKAHK